MEETAMTWLHRSLLLARGAALIAAAAAAGCTSVPVQEPAASGAVFYPPLPNPPRIQHLATLTGERDFAARESQFAKFVLGEDTDARRLRQPYGLALFDGKIYVADSKGPGLAVFDLVQQRFSLMNGSGNGRMRHPVNVTIDGDGTKYVTDTGLNQVLVYDRAEKFLAAFGTRGQFKPVDTAIAGERLYVVDIEHHQVQVLDKRSGKMLFSFGKPGSGVGQLFHPTNIAIGPEGDIYVAETSNFRAQRFTADGVPVRVYGKAGDELGSFSRPKGIALDRAGRLYVGDSAFENVQIFDNGGRLLLYFGQPGSGAEGLNLPAGVKIDYANVDLFRRHADPRFAIEYLILVASQFGPNKVDVFGFGRMSGMEYPPDAMLAGKPIR
jgi:DNA-binding beta-propeller fold protein YncE